MQRKVYICLLENKFYTGTLLQTSFIQLVSTLCNILQALYACLIFPVKNGHKLFISQVLKILKYS